MADSVTLPAVGKVRQRYILYAVAGVGTFVGYAYWRRSRTIAAPAEDVGAAQTLPDPMLPTVTTTTVPENADVIDTNAKWTRQAVDYLAQTGGWDAAYVATVLGKFLARRGLTPNEEPVALAALAAFDQPPVGGPYNVISAPVAKPSPKLATPVISIRSKTATDLVIVWPNVPNATHYVVLRNSRGYRDVVRAPITVPRRDSVGWSRYQVRAEAASYTPSNLSNTVTGG